MSPERIGVFGGTFDPPHSGHLKVAQAVSLSFGVSRVLWMPAFTAPHKRGRTQASVEDRFEMTQLCTALDARFEVSALEIDRGGISYTVDTLQSLHDLFPGAQFHLILGADSYATFHLWKSPNRILELAKIVVYPRRCDGSGEKEEFSRVSWLDVKEIAISSSVVRSRIAEGKTIEGLVPPAVRTYIDEHSLYRRS